MRYQIYEAKSVKYDAQQRVGMIAKTSKTRINTEVLKGKTGVWQRFGNI